MLQAKLSPSMMCVNAWRDASEILAELIRQKVDYFHMDLMDGHFVPNLTLGTDCIKQLRKETRIPLDLHLMAEQPETMLDWLDLQPGELVSVHVESTRHLQRTLAEIRARGARPMAALNPATPLCMAEPVLEDVDGILIMTVNPGFAGQRLVPQTLKKIEELRRLLDLRGLTRTEIEVDGNVSFENAEKMRRAGASIFVGGTSSVFHTGGTLEENICTLRQRIAKGESAQ